MALTLDEQTFLIAMLVEVFQREPQWGAQQLVGSVLTAAQQEMVYDFLRARRNSALDAQVVKITENKDSVPPRGAP